MNSIVIQSRSGPDSKLHLEIPVNQPDTEFEIEVVVRPKRAAGKGWSPSYFDLFGSIDDETFVRPASKSTSSKSSSSSHLARKSKRSNHSNVRVHGK